MSKPRDWGLVFAGIAVAISFGLLLRAAWRNWL